MPVTSPTPVPSAAAALGHVPGTTTRHHDAATRQRTASWAAEVVPFASSAGRSLVDIDEADPAPALLEKVRLRFGDRDDAWVLWWR